MMPTTARKTRPISRGFTLIELMIVVAIIGILVSISVPQFMRFQCRAKQSESKEILKAIFIAELEYNADNNRYLNLTDLTTYGGLDNKSVTGGRYYDYSITVTGGSNFDALAQDTRTPVSNSGVRDQWRVTESNPMPLNTQNGCRGF